jgi:hypothetical protein
MLQIRAVSALVAAILPATIMSSIPPNDTVATGTPACGLTQRIVQESSGGIWTYSRPNAFDVSGQRYCIRPNASTPGFTVMNNLRYTGLWQAYPFTGVGCAYNYCTRNTDLPKRVSSLPYGANVSWSWRGANAPGIWNAAFDDWFDKSDNTTTQNNGAELMIWLRTMPGYGGGQRVRIGHRWYWFLHWRAHNGPVSWWYVQFRTMKTVTGVKNLWLKPFLTFMKRRGLMQPSWYLTSIHAGYEIVSGSKGLHTTWFNAHV